ncbi:MAG: hypothetical protein JXX14_22535 [Deltaproteobacteria bacterium]|nr:hypothetical protein [Deltaproteobacteria bacterium]
MMTIRISVFLFLLFLMPLQALGWNPTTACPKTPDDQVKAQMTAGNLFAEAEADYSASKPLKALKGFLCSHRIMPHENTIFNIVQIAKLAEQREASIRLLKDFVAHVEGEHITQPIKEIISDLENGDSALASDAAETENDLQNDQGADAGETENQETPTKPEGPVPSDAQHTDDGATDGDNFASQMKMEKAAARKRKLKIAGITLMAVGGSALIAGGTFQFLAGRSQQKASDTDSFSIFENQQDKMGKYQTGAIIGYISGGLILGTGGVLTLLSRKTEVLQTSKLTISPSYRGLFLSGRF